MTASVAPTSTVASVEDRLAALVEPVMADMGRYLPDREPAEYLYDAVADYPRRGAKGLRPAILIATCQAFGGRAESALLPAISIELLHNALLVHDDVQDGSDMRRGRPALHHLIGEPLAINAGDALAMFSLRPLHEAVDGLGTRIGRLMMDEFHRMTEYALQGQALELGWTKDNVVDLTDEDYLRLIMLKTCWYTTVYPLRVGALIGARGANDLDPLIRFGYFLGAAFQIQDDLLNLEGDESLYGKELLGDLLEGKRTVPLLHLVRSLDADTRADVVELLSRPRVGRTVDDVVWMRSLMDQAGSIEYTHAFARGIAAEAVTAFDAAMGHLAPSDAKRLLRDLIDYMLQRRA